MKLKPCPFCGSRNVEVWNNGCWIVCNDCKCDGPMGEDVEESAKLWNRRAISANDARRAYSFFFGVGSG